VVQASVGSPNGSSICCTLTIHRNDAIDATQPPSFHESEAMGFLLCCYFLLPDAEVQPPLPPPLVSKQGVQRAVKLAEGMVLSGLVKKGMDFDQVRAILGPPSSFASNAGGFEDYYRSYGIQVFWGMSDGGAIRWPSALENAYEKYQICRLQVFWGMPSSFRFGPKLHVREVRYVWECWQHWGE